MAIAKRERAELAKRTFEYAPAPEATDHIKIEPRYGLFIGGRMTAAHSRKRFPTINPATEQKQSEVVEADEVDVDRAVKAASRAFDSWSRLEPARLRLSMRTLRNGAKLSAAALMFARRVRNSRSRRRFYLIELQIRWRS